MRVSRRNWLLGCGGVLTGQLVPAQTGRDSEAERRIRALVDQSRVVPGVCRLTVAGRSIEGLPLFDGAFTDPIGIRGQMGPLGSDADIGIVTAAPNTAAGGPLGDARRQSRHKAIVITRGGRPGLYLAR